MKLQNNIANINTYVAQSIDLITSFRDMVNKESGEECKKRKYEEVEKKPDRKKKSKHTDKKKKSKHAEKKERKEKKSKRKGEKDLIDTTTTIPDKKSSNGPLVINGKILNLGDLLTFTKDKEEKPEKDDFLSLNQWIDNYVVHV